MKTKKQGRIRSFYRNLLEEFHKDKSTFIIYITLRTLVILIAVLQFLNGNYENAMLCVFTLLLFLIPAFVQATFRVELPSALEIIVLFFIFAAEILGEINDYYVKYAFWDTMLHTANGFLAAAVGLSLIDILNKSERVQLSLSPLFVALTSFCFSMTIGVLWEFFEFGMDYFFLTDMQKDARSHAYFLGLPKSGERQPRRADQKYHRYSGQRAKSRDQRVSGHRPLRHDERSAGQFCGRGGLFDHWILLHQIFRPRPRTARGGRATHHQTSIRRSRVPGCNPRSGTGRRRGGPLRRYALTERLLCRTRMRGLSRASLSPR